MKVLPLLLAIASLLAFAATPASVQAQVGTRAYAPENLRELSVADQRRVISLEYAEQSRGRNIPDDQLRFYLDQVNRSNWGFSRIKQDIATSLSGAGTSPPRPPQPPQPPTGSTIRCESFNNRASICPTPWAGPSRLVRSLSSTRCVEGQSWQSQQGQVYVGNNCRAEFAAAVAVQPPASHDVTCRSVLIFPGECSWRRADGMPVLKRQLSAAACVEGRSWSYDERRERITVRNGCSAEFGRQSGGGVPGPGAYSVTCVSTGNRQQRCAWNARQGRPYLIEQLAGSTRCIEGRTWGRDGNQSIWVSGGCRARFGVR